MKGRLKLVVPLAVLILAGAGYQMVLAKGGPQAAPRIRGDVVALPQDFLLNLRDGHFAKLSVALVLAPGQSAGGGAEAAPPPEGWAGIPEEAAVRDIVTGTVTGVSAGRLIGASGRAALKRAILRAIKRDTDVRVNQVLFTDVAVQ